MASSLSLNGSEDVYVGAAAFAGYKGPVTIPGGIGDAVVLHIPGPQADGAACTHALECKSDFCVSGVCCNAKCNNVCEACSAATKNSGVDGVCGAAKADTDPGDRCPAGTTAYGPDGLCDGAGKCRAFAKPGVTCGASTCTASVQTNKVCKGDADSCVDATVSCGGYACGDSTCKTSCTVDTDCAKSSYCFGGTCVLRLENGKDCSEDRVCASGIYVDGVCCGSRCGGQCEACDGPVKGTCSPITGAPHKGRPVCLGVGDCAATCNGTDPNTCKMPVGKVCGAKCDGTTQTLDTCNNIGGCKPGEPTSCGLYLCGATHCEASCTSTGDCAVGATCVTGKCRGPGENGKTCKGDDECLSGFCTDGVCCNAKCDGQCEACRRTGEGHLLRHQRRAAREACFVHGRGHVWRPL